MVTLSEGHSQVALTSGGSTAVNVSGRIKQGRTSMHAQILAAKEHSHYRKSE